MNSFAAANLFENPLVLLAILLIGAVSSWLTKRRQQSDASDESGANERLPSQGEQARPFNLEDALRRALGEESPPPQTPTPPPIPHASRDEQPSPIPTADESLQPERVWVSETQEVQEKARQLAQQTAERLRQQTILVQASARRIEAGERHAKAARRFAQLNEQGRHPPTVVSTERGRRSRAGARAGSFWHNSHTVRQAFIASLVFGTPKGLEN